jgi:D-serine deaminase-like pyridoxal phosphate-dependent protein
MNPDSLAWNERLVGVPGGAARLDTPALVLDLDAFEANLEAMAAVARRHRVGLRPHAKTHKCVAVAEAQRAAGEVVGFCCAKLGEAEALARGGLDGLLLTAPVLGPSKIPRLLALAGRLRDLAVVVDDPGNLRELAEAAAAAAVRLGVLVVVDVGSHRFGVTSVEDAVALGRLAVAAPALELRGIQGYAGRIQHLPSYAERVAATRPVNALLARVRDAFRAAGLACPIVTGSGTGTHAEDASMGVFTELQVGSYPFMDVDYLACDLTGDGSRPFRPALFVWTRVVSNRQAGFVTTDAGSKCFATDGPAPAVAAGAPPGSTYAMFGDQFGRIDLPAGCNGLPLGTLVACIAPHCDPTVNLWDHVVAVRGGTVEAIWPIEGRGAVA